MEGDKQKKVQDLYRKIKQQNRDDNKIGRVVVNVCVFIIFLILVMNALFDAGFWFAQFWGR